MNNFGKLFKINIFGESHGANIGLLIEGLSPGILVSKEEIKLLLETRFLEKKFLSQRFEDEFEIISGVFNGKTSGAPLCVLFKNKSVDSSFYEKQKNIFRPSHADFTASVKYKNFNDYRGAGIFSGRSTVALIVAGYFAKKIISEIFNLDFSINSKLLYPDVNLNTDFLDSLKKEGDSTGGIIETVISNIPAGLGDPYFDGFEAVLSHLIFSIPGVKGLEFGKGFEIAKMKGSTANDVFIEAGGKTKTNNSGGINGGITNSNDIVFRVALRPTPSISLEQETLDFSKNEPSKLKIEGRHDVCFAFKVPVILEAVLFIVLCDFLMLDR